MSLLLHEVPAAEQAAKEGLKLADAGTSEHTLLELRLVQVMLQTGKVKQAISELQKIIDRNQNSADKAVQAEALLLKSKAFEQQGKLDASYASLMLSLDAADQSQDKELLERISFGMGHLLVRLNGFERSEKLLKRRLISSRTEGCPTTRCWCNWIWRSWLNVKARLKSPLTDIKRRWSWPECWVTACIAFASMWNWR